MISFRKWYERYFVISEVLQMLQVMDREDSELSLKIYQSQIMRIKDVSTPGQPTECPYKYFFTLVTSTRDYQLHAPTLEERDLWVESFH